MSNFDDLFESQPQPEQEDRPFDKDAWAEKKLEERQEVYELADKTTEEVSTDGNKYRNFLDVKTGPCGVGALIPGIQPRKRWLRRIQRLLCGLQALWRGCERL